MLFGPLRYAAWSYLELTKRERREFDSRLLHARPVNHQHWRDMYDTYDDGYEEGFDEGWKAATKELQKTK